MGRCKQKQRRLRGLLCRWPSIAEWEMYITAQGCRLRNDLYCVEWDVKLYYTIPSICSAWVCGMIGVCMHGVLCCHCQGLQYCWIPACRRLLASQQPIINPSLLSRHLRPFLVSHKHKMQNTNSDLQSTAYESSSRW